MANSVTDADTWSNNLSNGAAQVGEKIDDAASELKERASEFGRFAAQTMDETREGTAATLKSTADSVRTCGHISSKTMTDLAGKTAEQLESTANYVRDHDFRGMFGDIGRAIRRNPAPALIGALGLGFLLGSALKRSRD